MIVYSMKIKKLLKKKWKLFINKSKLSNNNNLTSEPPWTMITITYGNLKTECFGKIEMVDSTKPPLMLSPKLDKPS